MKRLILPFILGAASMAYAQNAEVYVDAASSFLYELNESQSEEARFPFNDEERENWHYFPKVRGGVNFHDLGPEKQALLLDTLKKIMSTDGFNTAEGIRGLETVLWEMQGQRGTRRDPGDYYLAVFGTPSMTEPWGLRYEGHHLSLNWTFVDGKVVSSTPQFLGTNPAEVPDGHGPMTGVRVLASLEDMPRELVKGLSEDQQAKAILSGEAPPEILTGADRVAAMQENKGITYAALTGDQRALLMSIIDEYANIHLPEVAASRLEKVKAGGLDAITFAWMGGLEQGQGHYYRIQGPTFLIEYDNTQNNANHAHTVWRDFDGDFGRDVLKEHYDSAHADHGHDVNLANRHPMRAWRSDTSGD